MLTIRRDLIKKHILNNDIKASSIRLIDEEGSQVGVINFEDAMKQAEEKNLDLMLISDSSTPPVCKLIDYGQYKYHQQKKDKKAKNFLRVKLQKSSN